MMSTVRNPNIIRGKLTDAEKAEIARLLETLRKPTASAIARKLNRHSATIGWYLISNCLIERKIRPSPSAPYQKRNGTMVYPWTPEQDARAEALRANGLTMREVGEVISREFNIIRNGHSVYDRLVMLAAQPEESAA